MPAVPTTGVVVPAYNCARFLARALRSVCAQVPAPADVVVVDDGSDDDPASVVAALGLPVRVVRHRCNEGLPAARNTGVREVRAEWVALLDADDEWRPGKLAAQLAVVAADARVDVVYTDFAHRSPDGSPVDWQGGLLARHRAWGVPAEPVPGVPDAVAHAAGLDHWLLAKTSFCHPSTVLVRRTLLERVGGFDRTYRSAEDLECWVRLAAAGRFALVDRVLVDVDQRPDSLGHQRVRAGEHLLRLYDEVLTRDPELPAWVLAEVAARVARTHADLGYEYRRAGDTAAARRHLRAAARLAPSWRNRVALLKGVILPTVSRLRGEH